MNEDLSRYRIGPDDQIEDVDLDAEEVHLPDGRRLTNEVAEQIAGEVPQLQSRFVLAIQHGKSEHEGS